MQVLNYKVSHLPDLECTEYHARYGDNPSAQLIQMQENFLHTMHTISRQYPLRCSLIYSFNPNEPQQDQKLQIYIRIIFEQCLEHGIATKIQKILESSFWRDFYKVESVKPLSNFDISWVQAISFGIRHEESLSPTVNRDNSPSHFYLLQPFEPNEDVDRVRFLSRLETSESQVLLEVIFQPTMLTRSESTALETLLRGLGEQTSYEVTTSEISGRIREKPVDPVAERTLRQFEDLREAIQNQLLYEVSIRIFSEDQFSASVLLNEFWVESSQKPLYREITISSEDTRFPNIIKAFHEGTLCPELIWLDYWGNLSETSLLLKLKRLHRLFTIEDLSACFRVVVPDPVVVFSSIPKETDLKSFHAEKNIFVGWQAGKSQNQAQILLKNLNKHIFICGVPGSGKTTAVLNLLFQLWTEHQIPFLVIEPAKTEYRSMLSCSYDEVAIHQADKADGQTFNKAYTKTRNVSNSITAMKSDLRIYSLGNERVCPFRFNPFAFYGTITLDEHISTLEACFKAAMPLFGPLPALLAEAIERVYAQQGWQPQDTAEKGFSLGYVFPTMQELYETVTSILETKQYSSDVAGDIKTALEVRIGGLLRRSVGSMLNTRTSTPSIRDLLEKPIILELDSLNENQANLMTMFILATLREYARVTRKSGSPLKHVVVIEEAHNIVGADASGNKEEGTSNPKAEAAKYIVRMLAEMRALGEGMIIADQLPSAVSPEVIKNTSIKLAHRTVSGDDREILQQAMLLTRNQSEELARANPGDAYLFMEGTYKPVRIKEPNIKLVYGIEEPPSNEELVELIQHQIFYQEAIKNKDDLYQQKVKIRSQEVEERLQVIIENHSTLLAAGYSLIQQPIAQSDDLEQMTHALQELQEFSEAISALPNSFDTEVQRIWSELRQEGIFDAVLMNTEVALWNKKLTQCQFDLTQLNKSCDHRVNEVKEKFSHLKGKNRLLAEFNRIKNYHDIYIQKASIIIGEDEPHEVIQAAYQEAQNIADQFYQSVELFNTKDFEYSTDFINGLKDVIEKMRNLVAETEEQISSFLR